MAVGGPRGQPVAEARCVRGCRTNGPVRLLCRACLFSAALRCSDLRAQAASVAADTSVPARPARIEFAYDTLVRKGFGPFAPLPRRLRRCVRRAPAIDTLVFGDIVASAGDNEPDGTEISLQVVGDSMRGYIRIADGGVSGPYTLQGLTYDASTDSVRYWWTYGGRGEHDVAARFTCSAMRGVSTYTFLPWRREPGGTRKRAIRLPRLKEQYWDPYAAPSN